MLAGHLDVAVALAAQGLLVPPSLGPVAVGITEGPLACFFPPHFPQEAGSGTTCCPRANSPAQNPL